MIFVLNLRIKSIGRRVTIAFSIDHDNAVVAVLGIFYGGREFQLLLKDLGNDDD